MGLYTLARVVEAYRKGWWDTIGRDGESSLKVTFGVHWRELSKSIGWDGIRSSLDGIVGVSLKGWMKT